MERHEAVGPRVHEALLGKDKLSRDEALQIWREFGPYRKSEWFGRPESIPYGWTVPAGFVAALQNDYHRWCKETGAQCRWGKLRGNLSPWMVEVDLLAPPSRADRAFALRERGLSYRAIAQIFDMSADGAHQLVDKGRRRHLHPSRRLVPEPFHVRELGLSRDKALRLRDTVAGLFGLAARPERAEPSVLARLFPHMADRMQGGKVRRPAGVHTPGCDGSTPSPATCHG